MVNKNYIKRVDKNLVMKVDDITKLKCPKCGERNCIYDSYSGTGTIICMTCTFCFNKNTGNVLNEGGLK